MASLPESIAAARTAMGLTQHQFAKAVGVSAQAVSAWEGGRRNPSGPALTCMDLLYSQKVGGESPIKEWL